VTLPLPRVLFVCVENSYEFRAVRDRIERQVRELLAGL
jgi:hypothetical protein